MTFVVLPLPGNTALAEGLARMPHAELGQIGVHRFPDGETFVQIESPVEGKSVVIACTLDRPDDKILPLLFTADAARELGASQVGLVAPYLGYMRQDKRFHPGEAITSHSFAKLLSRGFDFLVTVDPHLHRYRSLDEIYAIQTRVVHAAPAIAEWIKTQVTSPVLIGPDSESEQWVADVARNAGAPYTVLEKVRRGDRDVEVSVPDAGRWKAHTPVLVDDIISTARTMIRTIVHLKQAELPAPVCVGVHAVLAQAAYDDLMDAGAARVVTCNTVRHVSNQIDLVPSIANAAQDLLLSEPALLRRSHS